MKYRVSWKPKASKQLSKLPKEIIPRLVIAVRTLEDSDQWHNVRALKNHQYSHRLRVGNYRVLFDADDVICIVSIEEVKKRDDRTY